jgi:nicotinate-nucleotide adenylyltransferase
MKTHFSPPTPYSGTLWAGRTVGLLGGSFNPAHGGHRHISLHALKALGLDAVWWMASPQNPLKEKRGMAPLAARLKSACAKARHPAIVVTDIEARLGTCYTADTLRALKKLYPRTRFVWLMGSDNLQQVHLWKDWEYIFRTVPVCVVDRPPNESRRKSCPALLRFRARMVEQSAAATILSRPLPSWTILHTPLNAASSTQIRRPS